MPNFTKYRLPLPPQPPVHHHRCEMCEAGVIRENCDCRHRYPVFCDACEQKALNNLPK